MDSKQKAALMLGVMQGITGVSIDVAAEMAAITPAVQADLVKDAERVFIKKIAEQTPERPDYWSECGQCSCNISEAQDLIDAAIAAEKKVTSKGSEDTHANR